MRKALDCQEYKEIIAAHVDGDLSFEERLEVQSHLKRCPNCAQKFLWETRVSNALRGKLTPIPARPGLKETIVDQLGEASREGFMSWFSMPHRLAAVLAFLLIVAVPYFVWQRKIEEAIFTDAIAQYQRITHGIGEIPQAASSLSPSARLLDLSPWGYRVLTRQSVQLRGQEARVFVYQGPSKEYLLAQELDGADFSLPSGARVIRASSREFVSYSQEGVNLIAFKEKDLLCILASTLPKEKLLGLAQQIAVRG